MATEAQIAANRENAQSSTGPRTEEGQTVASRNALTFGLYTRTDYVRPEDQDIYEEFCEALYTELYPVGLLEETLVSEITSATWRLRCCAAAEAHISDFDESTDKTRHSVERARAHAHSILNRAVNQLRKLQTERTCRMMLNATGGEEGLADYQQVVKATNDYERGKHLHAKSRAMNLSSELASFCEASGYAPEGALVSDCEPVQIARNAPCPCNSGEKYKRCCGRNAPPVLTTENRQAA